MRSRVGVSTRSVVVVRHPTSPYPRSSAKICSGETFFWENFEELRIKHAWRKHETLQWGIMCEGLSACTCSSLCGRERQKLLWVVARITTRTCMTWRGFDSTAVAVNGKQKRMHRHPTYFKLYITEILTVLPIRPAQAFYVSDCESSTQISKRAHMTTHQIGKIRNSAQAWYVTENYAWW